MVLPHFGFTKLWLAVQEGFNKRRLTNRMDSLDVSISASGVKSGDNGSVQGLLI